MARPKWKPASAIETAMALDIKTLIDQLDRREDLQDRVKIAEIAKRYNIKRILE